MDSEDLNLDFGVCEISVYVKDGRAVFEKEFPSNKLEFLKNLEAILIGEMFARLPPNKGHRESSIKENIAKEILTNSLWRDAGIPSLELVEAGNRKIIWEYVPSSRTVRQKLLEEENPKSYGNFLELYKCIRDLAIKKNDPEYLHSDPHLRNFLVRSDDTVLPIDSGCILNPNLTLQEVNTYLLYKTIYSIYSEDLSKEKKTKYIDMFVDSLSKIERDNVLNISSKASLATELYFLFKKNLVSAFTNRSFENHFKIYRNFEKYWDEYTQASSK